MGGYRPAGRSQTGAAGGAGATGFTGAAAGSGGESGAGFAGAGTGTVACCLATRGAWDGIALGRGTIRSASRSAGITGREGGVSGRGPGGGGSGGVAAGVGGGGFGAATGGRKYISTTRAMDGTGIGRPHGKTTSPKRPWSSSAATITAGTRPRDAGAAWRIRRSRRPRSGTAAARITVSAPSLMVARKGRTRQFDNHRRRGRQERRSVKRHIRPLH
ncbi:hypothetical protein GDI2519 [Gluconacetobacter diazotrophicus PA1 5]|uniref:Uncharacterized protein n=1 Tax=Gluconacetobacter diazotrophicus (strain ATCC 49037 / DSM 5601 / CCUG 37298 / CIP 103539 / LMG 7603 / PAl5) TaxID=272568 RepID=A9HNM0_GLUDA|nr:hypothetical protein GDI2519 [Gluconacetobacter diazotrophicus PA1 5]